MKKPIWIPAIVLIALITVVVLYHLWDHHEMVSYYENQNNYRTIEATVLSIEESSNNSDITIYLDFDYYDAGFSGWGLRIVGENAEIARANGILECIPGDQVTFVAAPKCFGDGYAAPIIGLEKDNLVILDSKEGYSNLLKWLSFN